MKNLLTLLYTLYQALNLKPTDFEKRQSEVQNCWLICGFYD